jgi:signal transduction histidine kinase
LYRWLRVHVLLVDALIAAVIGLFAVLPFVAMAIGRPTADRIATAVVSAGLVLPLVWRRTRPVPAAAVMVVVSLVQLFSGMGVVVGQVAVLLMVAALAAHAPRWASRAGLTIAILGMAGLAVRGHLVAGSAETPLARLTVALLGWSMVVAAWLFGDLTRSRIAERQALADRAERLEHEQAQARELAAAEERARIVRELHDVIGVLSSEAPDQPPTAPTPGVADLDTLVAQVRGAGVEVVLHRDGEPPTDLPAGAQLVLYRVVQESLTNVLKHAGPGTRADVQVRWTEVAADVTVHDTGPGLRHDGDGIGRGLRGMRERLAMYDGEVSIGDAPSGGVVVHARLPLAGVRGENG